MKTFGKSARRLFKKHMTRLITIIAIVTVSIGVTSGIGEVENRIKNAAIGFYTDAAIADITIKCTRITTLPDGTTVNTFTPDELAQITELFGQENILTSFCYESESEQELTRIYTYDFSADAVNKVQLLDGRLPAADNEILAERKTESLKSYRTGDIVTVDGREYTVTGIILHPFYINKVEEPSFTDPQKPLDYVLYRNTAPPLINDVYALYAERSLFKAYGKSYNKKINMLKAELYATLGPENVRILDLRENVGIRSLLSYAEKVGLISIIFIVFFLLVTMLVVYSNMTRLLDEERPQIACLKTLGYSDFAIVSRYSLFVLIGTLVGGLLALPIGLGVTYILYRAFNMQYAMPPFPGVTHLVYYAVTFFIIVAAMLLLTFFTGLKTVRHKPVTLLSHKAPKSGKKVFLERIPFLWNRLSFKYKSTIRNLLLFKSRFLMTVISVIGSTVLVLAGFGLMDCSLTLQNASSILSIAVVLIVFSALLCALVIYNITNINVSERNREIATLMVLGYQDREVTGYIFREVYIMCFIGALLGLPFGFAFLQFVFNLIDFGTIAEINWWTWILTPAVTMLFAFFSTLLLRRKITRTDMNASLKIRE